MVNANPRRVRLVPVGLSKPTDTSESIDAATTPCWQKQQMEVTGAEDRSNGGLAPSSEIEDF